MLLRERQEATDLKANEQGVWEGGQDDEDQEEVADDCDPDGVWSWNLGHCIRT